MQILAIVFLTSIATICLSWLLPRYLQLKAIGLVTALFLGYYSPLSLAILLSTSCLNYYFLHKSKLALKYNVLVSILIEVCFLFYFKITGALNLSSHAILIPLGISYYTFRQIHYAIEVNNKKVPVHTFEEYMVYLFFIPTILIGPIHRFQDFLKDLRRRRWDNSRASNGLQRCLYGYAKIIILGNYFFSGWFPQFIDRFNDSKPWLAYYLEMVRYPLNAYFQFAGFSDIAIGLSLLMGFKVMENFNNPFWSENVNEFWRKYHISLSSWCREYIFTPIASYTRRPYLSVIISMFVLSIWHEFTWQYIAWGFIQAAGIIVSIKLNRYPNFISKDSKWSFLEKIPKSVMVFHFFAASCILLNEDFLNLLVVQFSHFVNF